MRYKKKSKRYRWEAQPALTPASPAFFSPIFLITKLDPIKALDDVANAKPLKLSRDITMFDSIFCHLQYPNTYPTHEMD
jgi:hypothetical protein